MEWGWDSTARTRSYPPEGNIELRAVWARGMDGGVDPALRLMVGPLSWWRNLAVGVKLAPLRQGGASRTMPTKSSIEEQIEYLKRGVVDLIREDDLRRKLER